MKKNLIAFLLVLLLSGVAAYLIFSDDKTTIKKELSDFAIKDTGNITKVFLANSRGEKVLLEKKENNEWLINGKYGARKDLIRNLLFTLYHVSVKAPVAKSSYEKVVKDLAGNSTKCEVYSKDNQLIKTIYVGSSTADGFGTYMLLEGSSTPFVMEIKGHNGYLSTRFFTDETAWRNTVIFQYKIEDIKNITINNFKHPENSFKIESTGKSKFRILLSNNEEMQNIDTVKLYEYLNLYQKVGFEYYSDNYTRKTEQDSIKTQENLKMFQLSVTNQNNETETINAFLKPVPNGTKNFEEQEIEYDLDRFYGTVFGGKSWVVMQYFVFDKIVIPVNYFQKNNTNSTATQTIK